MIRDFRLWLIGKLAGRDIQVMCNIVIRRGCWYVAESDVICQNVTFCNNQMHFETPEMEALFRKWAKERM